MAKDKKKDGKKTEKVAPAPAPETSFEDSFSKLSCVQTSLNQAEEAQASPLEPQEEPKEVEEPKIQEAVQIYEEPILTQLIVENYEGEKVHGLYEGEGVAYFQGGNIYRGMFSEGLMHGHGTYIWADGVKYEGNFVKNVQMYNGSYTWPDGSTYEGEVKNGIRHGFGKFKFGTHPVSYIGQWCEGKRHGKGNIYYNQEGTSWYEGDLVNNVKDGWGIRCYKSGNIYEGQWGKNVRHGEGRMRWLTTNQEYTGKWVNGIQHGYGTHTWFLKRIPESQYPLRNEYVGDFVNGDRHGHGRFFYSSGAMYDGEWVCNKKHGFGRFVFKNGHIYEGEFINDQIAEYPAFQVDAMNTQDLSGIRTQSPFGTEAIRIVDGPGNTSLLGSDIELDISSLLNLFPEKDRQEEMKQVEYVVLRHITVLRRLYCLYSGLGSDPSLDNTFLMTKLQFWKFLKDCRFHHYNVTLAEMDRILNEGKTTPEEMHSPYETLLLRTFLTYLIHLAVHIYHKEHKLCDKGRCNLQLCFKCRDKGPYLFKCFSAMMMKNIIPNSSRVQGIIFYERQAICAINYIDKCWEIYRAYCRPNTIPPYEPTMKMRHFLWMLKDLNMLSKQLTATKIVEILAKDNPFVRDRDNSNLQYELVFLEFLEALLECAVLYVTNDMIKQQADRLNKKGSSYTIEDYTGSSTGNIPPHSEYSSFQSFHSSAEISHDSSETNHIPTRSSSKLAQSPDNKIKKPEIKSKDYAVEHRTFRQTVKSSEEEKDKLEKAKNEQKEKYSLWLNQIHIFLVNTFFPAYKHAQVVKECIKENRKRDAELAIQLKIKEEEEEEAKLMARREAEETKKQEEAAADQAETDDGLVKTEPEDSATQLPLPPKEEVVIPPQPIISKVSAGVKKKKK
uniref:Radial spoke head 10 homolog B n=1 Tax=Pelodiscus sinensis TaxID=13735 RepID=K7G4W9_PELSI